MDEDLLVAIVGLTWGVIGVGYVAICAWLGIRIVNRRERWAKWTALALSIAPVLYVLSSGPAVWIYERTDDEFVHRVLQSLYSPLGWLGQHGPQPISDLFDWWEGLWAP